MMLQTNTGRKTDKNNNLKEIYRDLEAERKTMKEDNYSI